VVVQSANTGGGSGLRLEVHDLAVSKLVAGREKDLGFVAGLLYFDGLPHLAIEGPRNRSYRIEANDSLHDSSGWEELVTFSAVPYTWTDSQSGGRSNRFYRAVLLPEN
jgi:hypothetical protein